MAETKAKPETLYDYAIGKGPVSAPTLTLEEALAQVDELDNGDEELKELYRLGYNMKNPKHANK
ncbi:MAG: hypothetical protein WBC91_22130 [Phototrophicaceae bacterium]